MKIRHSLSMMFALFVAADAVHAQDLMSALRPTDKSYQQLAVFDVGPAGIPLEKVEGAVLSAIQVYASRAHADRKLMPTSLPDFPGTLTFEDVKLPFGMSIAIPKCPGAVDVINSSDTDMAQYGETTSATACIFAYRDGYRVHYYARFSESTGGTAAQVGAAIGKLFTRAVGLGDSSKFIGITIDNIQIKLKDAGIAAKLVGLQPAMEGKVVEKDSLAEAIAADKQQQDAKGNAIDARKQLVGIGLNPNSQDDFFSAIQRGDKLAVRLFIQADSIDINQPDKTGKRPLQLARRKEVIDLLTNAGAT